MNTSEVEFIFTLPERPNEEFKENLRLTFVEDELEILLTQIAHKLPKTVRYTDELSSLRTQLKKFIKAEKRKALDSFEYPTTEPTDDLIQSTESLFRSEITKFSGKKSPSSDEVFVGQFHNLIHSASLGEVISVKKLFAQKINDLNREMERNMDDLHSIQQREVDHTLNKIDVSTDTVNELICRQMSLQDIQRDRYENNLKAEISHQKNKFRNVVSSGNFSMKAFADMNFRKSVSFDLPDSEEYTPMEESFTTHLGMQLKHMHNIRILNADVRKFCSPLYSTGDGLSALNILMDLYSNSLSGLVVLTPLDDFKTNGPDNILRCSNMSTEFHFDTMNKQFEDIKNCGKDLKIGDICITKHSNLTHSHVVFHLLTDNFSRAEEINSRNPLILGLRNIFKIASTYDITTITIPALLKHEMGEDMTVQWCIRRAELILKCAKGFIIEAVSWGGAQVSTLQLLLPPDISEDLFSTLAAMVPNIFRVSNTKILVAN